MSRRSSGVLDSALDRGERRGRAHARPAAGAQGGGRRRRGRPRLHAAARRAARSRRGSPDPRAGAGQHAGLGRGAPAPATTSSSLRYEVMYLLEADDSTIDAFKQTWAAPRRLDRGGRWRRSLELPRAHRRHRTARSKPGSRRDARASSGSPTCSSRSRRSSGCASRTSVAGAARARGRGASRRSRPRSSRSASARASKRLLVSLGVHEIVAGGQSMNPSTAQILEAVERCPCRRGRRAPEQQEHRAVVAPGRRAVGATGRGGPDDLGGRGAWPRSWPTTRTPELDDNVAAMDEAAGACRGRRGDPGGARQRGGVRRDRGGRLDRDQSRGICDTASNPVDAALALIARARDRRQRDRDGAGGVGGAQRGHRARPCSRSRSCTRRSRSRCTRVANRSTRI